MSKAPALSDPESLRFHAAEQHILSRLASGEFPPGARLPSLRAASRGLSVSIATASRAYQELERKGLIEARPRSGYFVRRGVGGLPEPRSAPSRPAPPIAVNRSGLIAASLSALGDASLLPLGVVCPSPGVLPGPQLARIMAGVLRREAGRDLNYTPIAGHMELRRHVAFLRQAIGEAAAPEDVVITCGAMEALYIALRVLTRPGDAVVIPTPTYYCFLQLLETLGVRAVEVRSHPGRGVDPGELADALDRHEVAACVLCPNFNNPDGSLMPEEAKAEVVRLLAERDIPLVEDDVYGDLPFGPGRPGTCKAHDGKGLVLSCSSFSKTLAPGWRVGWILPGRFMAEALRMKSSTNVSTAAPVQMALAEYLAGGRLERHLKTLRQVNQRSVASLRHCLSAEFPPGTRASDPQGGSHLWVELPPGCDGVDLFLKAREAGIGIVPGNVFSTRDEFRNFIRLSSGGLWNEKLSDGVRTLGRLAAEGAGSV
ncbi:MAG: PLP-dependent aminotransferase family protein [Thermodesulfobacteriota bacterium]